MTPQLYTKVVFTQQIKRRLRLKTFFISPVIVVSKSFGFTSIFVPVRPLLPFPIGQRASLVPKVDERLVVKGNDVRCIIDCVDGKSS